jgi:hypothetical protein
MKKMLMVSLCLGMTLAACGGGEEPEENNSSATNNQSTPQQDMASGQQDMGGNSTTPEDMNTSSNNTTTSPEDMGMTSPPEDMGSDEDMATPPVDMNTTPPADMGGGDPDMMAGDFATMKGVVTRSVEPVNGGVGDLYVAIFDGNPQTGQGTLVATAIIEDVDMNPPGIQVPYEVTMIPVRAESYYYTAFLDDNNTVDQSDPDNAGPDKDDLIHVSGFSIPQRSFDSATQYDVDIDLNLALPF